MNLSPIAFAYGAGILAAFNPCGFVLLPTYAAALAADGNSQSGLKSALGVIARLTAGFLVVFVSIGVVVGLLGRSASEVGALASWLGVVVGSVFILMGASMLFGLKMSGINLHIGSTRGAFSYGVGYAAASLACALPVFLSAVVFAFDRGGLFDGIGSGISYALGMGTVVAVVVALTSTARRGAINTLRSSARWFNPLAGVLMVIAGVVLIIRRWVEVPFLEDVSGAVVDFIDNNKAIPAASLAVVAIAAVLLTRFRKRRHSTTPPTGDFS